MVGNLRVKTFRHFGDMPIHAGTEFLQQLSVFVCEMKVALHFFDENSRWCVRSEPAETFEDGNTPQLCE